MLWTSPTIIPRKSIMFVGNNFSHTSGVWYTRWPGYKKPAVAKVNKKTSVRAFDSEESRNSYKTVLKWTDELY